MDPVTNRLRGRDATWLALAALAVRLPAWFADRHFHPDDGTYGMSALAMRDGHAPFRTVFSSQGPAHLVFVFLGDLATGRTTNSPRSIAVVAGVVATLAAAAIGARVSGRMGAWIAGTLVATTGSMLWTSGPLTADAITIAFVGLAFVAALRYEDDPTLARAVLVGALIGTGMSAKIAVALLGMLPAVVALARRNVRHLVAAGASAAAVAVAFAAPFGFSKVWDQAVQYQLETERERSIAANAAKIVTTLWSRDLVLVMVAIAAFASVVAARNGVNSHQRGLAWWAVLMAAFLAVQPALWRNHLSHLTMPLALLAASSWRGLPLRGRVRTLAALVLVLLVGVQLRFTTSILHPRPYDSNTQSAADALGELPSDARVISDEVGIVWRAGRRTPDDLVDMSIKQFQQDRIDLDRILESSSSPDVCGVLVWSARHLGSLDGLAAGLAAEGYRPVRHFAGQNGGRVLYTRPCRI